MRLHLRIRARISNTRSVRGSDRWDEPCALCLCKCATSSSLTKSNMTGEGVRLLIRNETVKGNNNKKKRFRNPKTGYTRLRVLFRANV